MVRGVIFGLCALALVLAQGCDDATGTHGAADAAASDTATPDGDASRRPEVPLRPRSAATEYIGVSSVPPSDAATVLDALNHLFGPAAESSDLLTDFELQPGLFLTASADPGTSAQVVLTLSMDVSTGASPSRRVLTRVPASFGYGGVFIDTVAAALARTAEVGASEMQPFDLQYRSRTALGGELFIVVRFRAGQLGFGVIAKSPTTSLEIGRVNDAALTGTPFESVYGQVNFSLDRDEFDFFVNRAYGLSAGKSQNFRDFRLLPHDWLRLTVTPQLDDGLVDVGFELVTTDGRRVPVSRAPASLRAGEQFMQTVFRMVDSMNAQEKALPGTSVPWEVPFYYDDPNGGGVVEVIARGTGGQFNIAYAVETPVNQLDDVAFVPWQGTVSVPPNWDAPDPSCAEVGSEAAAQGYFDVTFSASSTILGSAKLDGPLVGPIWGSVYRAADVTLVGPNPGAQAVASWHFEDVDISTGLGTKSYRIDAPIAAGEYQLLGFMDIDSNAVPGAEDPDQGDPVTFPIGGFVMKCAVQPVVVEFALLRP
jgi:hypothetical protein